jgi:pentatricopeptide repeat protein
LPVRRLILSLVIIGREQEAQGLLNKLPAHDATRENPEYNDVVAGLAAATCGGRPDRLGAAARTLRTANILFEARETQLALKLFKCVNVKSGALRGMENEAMMQEARCFGRMGQADKALSVYQRLMRRVGRSKLASDALMRMAVLYAGLLGDRVKAMSCYEQVESEYPNTPNAEQAMFYRLTMLMIAGEWEDAAKLRAKFLKICKNGLVRNAVDVAYGDMVKRRSLKPKGK